MTQPVGIDWQISNLSGWGCLGLALALRLLDGDRWLPVPLVAPLLPQLSPLEGVILGPALAAHAELAPQLAAHAGRHPGSPARLDFPVLHSLGNDCRSMGTARGRRDVGIIFCENTAISAEGVARGRAFERLIAGSRWNAALLGAAGVDGVRVCWQGVDRTVFHPGPRSGRLRRRFVVFSGGKLEFRKGQDLVLAAFRIFRARHPEALLLTAWYNAWAGPSVGVTRAGLVTSEPPRTADGGLDLFAWAAAEGLPEGSFFDVGQLPNHAFGRLMREADVALFPNRCEGGTNVVAMECLACGVPAVLSANTGHLDLIDQVACYPLREQRPVAPAGPGDGTEGWGESSVEEIVETLECVYRRRDEAAAIGRRAAEQMVAWDWTARADDLLRTAGLA